MLKGLVYVSEANEDFDELAVRELARRAAERNVELGITGFLYFESGRFVQYIEGTAHSVDQLIARIEEDERHRVLKRVEQAIDVRRFPEWRMRWVRVTGFARLEEVLGDHLDFVRKYDMDPADWSPQVWGMVERIANLWPILDEFVP